ncbi:hypothetical protein GJ496_011825 [Pomphorhynchus laevis]|nr:hypothetical protein GJ496_011825 [Pomphorhynchus laevis]
MHCLSEKHKRNGSYPKNVNKDCKSFSKRLHLFVNSCCALKNEFTLFLNKPASMQLSKPVTKSPTSNQKQQLFDAHMLQSATKSIVRKSKVSKGRPLNIGLSTSPYFTNTRQTHILKLNRIEDINEKELCDDNHKLAKQVKFIILRTASFCQVDDPNAISEECSSKYAASSYYTLPSVSSSYSSFPYKPNIFYSQNHKALCPLSYQTNDINDGPKRISRNRKRIKLLRSKTIDANINNNGNNNRVLTYRSYRSADVAKRNNVHSINATVAGKVEETKMVGKSQQRCYKCTGYSNACQKNLEDKIIRIVNDMRDLRNGLNENNKLIRWLNQYISLGYDINSDRYINITTSILMKDDANKCLSGNILQPIPVAISKTAYEPDHVEDLNNDENQNNNDHKELAHTINYRLQRYNNSDFSMYIINPRINWKQLTVVNNSLKIVEINTIIPFTAACRLYESPKLIQIYTRSFGENHGLTLKETLLGLNIKKINANSSLYMAGLRETDCILNINDVCNLNLQSFNQELHRSLKSRIPIVRMITAKLSA